MFCITAEGIAVQNAAAMKAAADGPRAVRPAEHNLPGYPTPEVPGVPSVGQFATGGPSPSRARRDVPTPPLWGVPTAANGIPAAAHSPESDIHPLPGLPRSAEAYRRPYIEQSHAARSPANAPGLASQSAPVSELAMTTVGRRP
jgi:hypothetical protein